MVTFTLLAINNNRVIHQVITQSTRDINWEFKNLWYFMKQQDEDFPFYDYSFIINRWMDDYDFPTLIINWHGTNIPNFLKQ